MKILLFLIFIVLTYTLDLQCNKSLLKTYDFEGLSDEFVINRMCTLEGHNCCSQQDQLKIYYKWIIHEQRKRLFNFYRNYLSTYTQIFDLFEKIEKQAEEVMVNQKALAHSSNCYQIASVVKNFQASQMKEKVISHVKQTYEFLYYSRKGFYCALCSNNDQQFFQKQGEDHFIQISREFCGSMINNTMNFYDFRYNDFMKIALLYSRFAWKCDLNGHFKADKFVPYGIRYFKETEMINDINLCKNALQSETELELCKNYCQLFNPVKKNKYLDSDIDKLNSFFVTLRQKSNTNQDQYNHEQKLKKKERILEIDEKQKSRILEGNDNAFTEFNRQFKSQLIKPMLYNFQNDISIKYQIDSDKDFFQLGIERKFNLENFDTKLEEEGIDFYELGKGTKISKVIASQVFKEIDPVQRKLQDSLVKNLKF